MLTKWPTDAGTRSSPRSTGATNADEISVSGPTKAISTRSQPIAIELPPPKKVNSAPVYTPPAPLSARGDLPGYVLISLCRYQDLLAAAV